ncbi:hypothetical protein H257_01670 [Aphanomyces astaci]|uniref:Uncharacterized protein n=1 Tax=Aphanomyces astaci TaxID=112090 RepID=W4H5T5_APHAT|nr:hypothetical protein H257_01670 [Aphanomyces astaci]ETV86488.1 hypothetical protein H257_01670 [Aphanomyces astaci]|eukprot:XP_009823287.1 hypothetical protein H257_01670 [Aphanomyces astaci]
MGCHSTLVNYPQVVAVDTLKAGPAATAVENATTKAADVVEEPLRIQRPTRLRSQLPSRLRQFQLQYGDYRDDQCGHSPFRQSDSATADTQATVTATTIAKTAGLTAPTKTTGATAAAAIPCTTTGAIVAAATVRLQPTKATPNRHPPPCAAKAATRRAALRLTATNSTSSAVAQYDSRSLAPTITH